MALDGIFLRHIKHEIENEILGSRVRPARIFGQQKAPAIGKG